MRYKYLPLLILFFAGSVNIFSQNLAWDLDFNFRFDNREYEKLDFPESKTLFGVSLVPQVGISWDHTHSIMTGLYYCKDFGTSLKSYDVNLYLYYAYSNKKFGINAGLFPRNKIIGDYSNLFFSDSVKFYDHDLEGLLFQYSGKRGYAEVIMDWMGKFSEKNREKFMIFGTGRYLFGNLYIGLDFSMFHYAESVHDLGVVDNHIINPYIGYKKRQLWFFDMFDVKAGWIEAYQRDRLQTEEVDFRSGVHFDLKLEKKRVGVYNSIYLGENLMPYYQSYDSSGNPYSTSLYYGERFYGKENGIYNRTEFYWNPNIAKWLDFKISYIIHYDGKNIGSQQLLTLIIDLNRH